MQAPGDSAEKPSRKGLKGLENRLVKVPTGPRVGAYSCAINMILCELVL